MKNKDIEIMASKQQNYKKHCIWCGHTISFYSFEPQKKLCSYCRRYTYKDKKAEFKDKLRISLLKVK